MSITYLKNLMVATSCWFNALLAGWPDERFSSRAYRWHVNGKCSWPMYLIDAIFFFDPDHCKSSYEGELIGRFRHRDYR